MKKMYIPSALRSAPVHRPFFYFCLTSLSFCLISLSMLCVASSAFAQDASSAAASSTLSQSSLLKAPTPWHPTQALAAHLGKPVQVGDYSVRTPVGYSELPLSPRAVAAEAKYGFETHIYGSVARPDGTSGMLLITVATLRPGKMGTVPRDVAIQDIVAGKRVGWRNAVISKPESGSVGGLPFERVYFRGFDLDNSAPRPAQGVAYVTQDAGKIVSIVAQVFGSQRKPLWPVVEAAAQTIHRR